MSGPGCKKVSPCHLYSAEALNKTKSNFLDWKNFGHRVFCHNANSLILNTVCVKNSLSL